MRNLINFLLRHSSWIVLAIYVAISCVLLVGRNPYQRSIYLSSANQVASAVYDLQSEVTSYFGLREVNRDLQLRNGELEMEVINLKEQLNRYRSSVGKDTIPFDSVLHDYDFAVARVVNNSVAQINNYITIDKGRAEGIEPEMGVVDQNGVVGIINVVGEHHSVAISVLNPKLRLSCKVKGSDYFGSLVWDAVSPRYAVLEEMPRHVEFAPGDTIVTSGYSSVFPEGIMVGIISDYKKQRDDNFYTLRVELSSDFSGLGYVRIISNRQKEEQDNDRGQKAQHAAHTGKNAVDHKAVHHRVDLIRRQGAVHNAGKPVDAKGHPVRKGGAHYAKGQPENKRHNARKTGQGSVFAGQDLINGNAALMLQAFARLHHRGGA